MISCAEAIIVAECRHQCLHSLQNTKISRTLAQAIPIGYKKIAFICSYSIIFLQQTHQIHSYVLWNVLNCQLSHNELHLNTAEQKRYLLIYCPNGNEQFQFSHSTQTQHKSPMYCNTTALQSDNGSFYLLNANIFTIGRLSFKLAVLATTHFTVAVTAVQLSTTQYTYM